MRGRTIDGNSVIFEFRDLGIQPWGDDAEVGVTEIVIDGKSYVNRTPRSANWHYDRAERDKQCLRWLGFTFVVVDDSTIFDDTPAIAGIFA